MKKIIILSLLCLILNPVISVHAQTAKENAQKQAQEIDKEELQQDAADAKKEAADTVNENLGTLTTPEQQKKAAAAVFKALDVVLDETMEEIKGSPNLSAEQEKKLIDALTKVSKNLDSCEAGVNAAKTQEELNTAYAKCVENIKQTINDFMNQVYDVVYELLNEYLKATKAFITSTQASITVLKTCTALDSTDVDELQAELANAEKLYKQAEEHYNATVNLPYARENLVKAINYTSQLSAMLARVYEEYEDLYYQYVDACGKGLQELDNPYEDLKQEAADEAKDTVEPYKDTAEMLKKYAN